MKILVTGGAGYLGSEVCRLAEADGHDVVATQLHAPSLFGRAIELDIRRPFEVDAEVVVHTAYVMGDEETIVDGTRNVAAAAERAGARLLHVSTDLVFDGEEGAPYSEDDEPRPVSDYGRAKLAAERLLPDAALIVRTSLLYGKAGPQERLAADPDAVFYTDEIRCPTRVDELAAALLELCGSDLRGILHLAGPEAVSRLEFARRLGAVDPRGVPAPQGRARNVALDSARAASLLKTGLTGIS